MLKLNATVMREKCQIFIYLLMISKSEVALGTSDRKTDTFELSGGTPVDVFALK